MDWIDEFLTETEKLKSPKRFRLWSAIAAVSGALERKVWTISVGGAIYPGIYTLLIGPPRSGKTSAISKVKSLWRNTKGMFTSPDDVTQASLIDSIALSLRSIPNGASGGIYMFSALSLPCSEFGVFFKSHDLPFLSMINTIYDDPIDYREARRTAGNKDLIKPHMTILAGTQPDYLGQFMPETAWGMGFTSRLIMIYGTSVATGDMFGTRADDAAFVNKLKVGLNRIVEINGEMEWTKDAMDAFNDWYRSDCPPRPNHHKLLHYTKERAVHTVKLCMISAASRDSYLKVTMPDFERAKGWLVEAEAVMPDIFRAMGQKSDIQLMRELHRHIYSVWASAAEKDRKPITTQDMYKFLHSRTTTERIQKIIDSMEKTGYIKRAMFPGEWIPKPIQEVKDIE